jgi:mono/diheme cytochrome c family protein
MEFIRCCSILILVLTVFALGCSADGEALFKKNCLGCHRFKGVGGSICPDLTEVTKRRSDDWIRQQLKDPSVNNPNSKMPDFSHLSDKQIQAIIDYLKS